MSVTNLADKKDDNRLWNVEQMLEAALRDLRAGKIHGNCAVLLLLDNTNGQYNTTSRVCNLSTTETIALCAVAQIDQYNSMR